MWKNINAFQYERNNITFKKKNKIKFYSLEDFLFNFSWEEHMRVGARTISKDLRSLGCMKNGGYNHTPNFLLLVFI